MMFVHKCMAQSTILQFSTLFMVSLHLLHWTLAYCFVVKSYSSILRLDVIDLFLQELRPLNLEIFKNFTVFWTPLFAIFLSRLLW
jgi:hypothetical protein